MKRRRETQKPPVVDRTDPTHEKLRQALADARSERDAALLELARERELTNALRLQLRADQPTNVPRYPAGTGLGPAPLRYQLVDKVNESAKRALGPMHGAAKKLLDRNRGRR
ncbi:MAG: hypothetical protein ABTQ32_18985 [Myxococcaceae bacterium]